MIKFFKIFKFSFFCKTVCLYASQNCFEQTMGALGIPKPWVPFINPKDCSQGFCTVYCPQRCHIIFPPPPPPVVLTPDENSGSSFSPIVIAVIAILASAFLLVSYCAIISRYCGNMGSSSSRIENQNHDPDMELEENHQEPSNHDQLFWHVSNNGLDEALIKSITVCKYKKGDGLIACTDCSVCLGEFQEDESLRLLPKCSHAFHVYCIDTWLRSHSNCPLCRANIGFVNSNLPPLLLPPPVAEIPVNSDTFSQTHSVQVGNGNAVAASEEEEVINESGNSVDGDTVIEIREEEGEEQIRRSVSTDYSCQSRVSMANELFINQEAHEFQMEECGFQGDDHVGSSIQLPETSKFSSRNRVLNCIMSHAAVKRSFSSGRLLFNKGWRGRNIVTPL